MRLFPETKAKIRLKHAKGATIKGLVRETGFSRNTIRNAIKSIGIINQKPMGRPSTLNNYKDQIIEWIEEHKGKKGKGKLTAEVVQTRLGLLNFSISQSAISRFLKKIKKENGHTIGFMPLDFYQGEAYQFDWFTEPAIISGVKCNLKIGLTQLSYSRMPYAAVYHCEKSEMVLDAHIKAFEFFQGVPEIGIYDNMKTVVKKILRGKERELTVMASQFFDLYKIEPRLCTPASGNEKGRVEKAGQDLRSEMAVEISKAIIVAKTVKEVEMQINKLIVDASKKKEHPTISGRTVYDCFEEEKKSLRPFNKVSEIELSHTKKVNSYSMIQFDTNFYSVPAEHVGETVYVNVSCDYVRVISNSQEIAKHPRCFLKYSYTYNMLHYIPILEKKPGSIRNGAPFRNGNIPKSIESVKDIMIKNPGGEREFIKILKACVSYGVDLVEKACTEALNNEVVTEPIISMKIVELSAGKVDFDTVVPANLSEIEQPTSNLTKYDTLLG